MSLRGHGETHGASFRCYRVSDEMGALQPRGFTDLGHW